MANKLLSMFPVAAEPVVAMSVSRPLRPALQLADDVSRLAHGRAASSHDQGERIRVIA